MRITVNREKMLKAFAKVASLIGGKPTVGKPGESPNSQPLKMVRMRVTDDGLEILGGSKEAFARIVVPGVEGGRLEWGTLLISPWRVIEILNAARGDDVILAGVDRQGIPTAIARDLSIKTRDSRFDLDGLDADTYPFVTPEAMPRLVDVGAVGLSAAIRRTVFSTDDDGPNTSMTFEAICFEVSKGMELCATSGSILSIARVPDAVRPEAKQGRTTDAKLGVPVKSVTKLKSFLPADAATVKIGTDDRLVSFQWEAGGLHVEFYSQLLEKRLPLYRKALPDFSQRAFYEISPKDLSLAAGALKPFAPETGILTETEADRWRFSCEASQVGSGWLEIPASGPREETHRLRLGAWMLGKYSDAARDLETVQVYVPDDPDGPVVFWSEDWTFVTTQCFATVPVPVNQFAKKAEAAA